MQEQRSEQQTDVLAAVHRSNNSLLDRTAHKVSYAPDLLAPTDGDDTIKASSVKGSRAGSVYYSASDSGTQSLSASVYHSGELDDSDTEFELELAEDSTLPATAKISQTLLAAHDVITTPHHVPKLEGGADEPPAAQKVDEGRANANDEFDYVFDKGVREGASYKRTFKAQPTPANLVTHLHQSQLGSLAEDSEEGSDAVSEPESGLIPDDKPEAGTASALAASENESRLSSHTHLDTHVHDPQQQEADSAQVDSDESSEPSEPGLMSALTELDGTTMHEHVSESVAAPGTPQRYGKKHAEPGADGMVELNMDDDTEAQSPGASFTEDVTAAGRKSFSASLHALPATGAMVSTASAAKYSSNAADAVTAGQGKGQAKAREPVAKPGVLQQAAFNQSATSPTAAAAIPTSEEMLQPPAAVAVLASSTAAAAAAVSTSAAADAAPADTDAFASPDVASPAAAAGTAAVSGGLDFQDIALDEIQLPADMAGGKSVEPNAMAAASKQPAGVHDEWEEVNLARARELAASADTTSNPIPGDKVRYPEALGYFLSADIKALKKGLKKSKPTHRFISCFMRLQTSSKRLEKERTRLLCLAKMPFDDNNMMHLRLLQTVYLNLAGGAGPVARYGSHWAAIGFQGLDPITDLRGCGVLGLLHLLLLHDHDPANAQALYRLSRTQESEFPLAPVSLNITKWTLQTLRDRKLSSAARKQQSMVTATSDFYTGIFYTFYNHWKDHKCTMADSGFVLKDVERRARGSPSAMIRQAAIRL